MTLKGRLRSASPMLKLFSGETKIPEYGTVEIEP